MVNERKWHVQGDIRDGNVDGVEHREGKESDIFARRQSCHTKVTSPQQDGAAERGSAGMNGGQKPRKCKL